jgi:hypothetical protein
MCREEGSRIGLSKSVLLVISDAEHVAKNTSVNHRVFVYNPESGRIREKYR